METKQIAHIVSEVILLGGITFYFNGQIKGLKSEIRDLKAEIEKQAEANNKHLNNLYSLMDKMGGQLARTSTPHALSLLPHPIPRGQPPPTTELRRRRSPSSEQPTTRQPHQHTRTYDSRSRNHAVVEELPTEDQDLDQELGEELQELEEEEEELESQQSSTTPARKSVTFSTKTPTQSSSLKSNKNNEQDEDDQESQLKDTSAANQDLSFVQSAIRPTTHSKKK